MGVPIAARGLSLAGALVLFVLTTQRLAGTLPGNPLVAGGFLLAALPFLALLAWIGLAPDHARPRLRRLAGVDLARPRHLLGLALHLVFLWVVFGLTIVQTSSVLSRYVRTGQHPASGGQLAGTDIVVSLILSLVFFVVAAGTWLWLVDELDLSGMVESLRLRLGELPLGTVAGIAVTIAGFAALGAVGFTMQELGIESPDNPQADAIASALSPWSAIVVAALAGIGEEIYFRGFLLDRVGNLAQASLFALVHASYLTAFQIILPFALGLAFGWVVRKTSLWTAIVSHTSFNAAMLLFAILSRDGELALAIPV